MQPWQTVMSEEPKSGGGKRAMAERLQGLRAVPGKEALAQTPVGLQTLLDNQLDRPFRGMLGGLLDADMLIKVVTKLLHKQGAQDDQTALEKDVHAWLEEVRRKYGDEVVNVGQQEALDRIDDAMNWYAQLLEDEGEQLDWAVFAQQGALATGNHDDEEFSKMLDMLLDFAHSRHEKGSGT